MRVTSHPLLAVLWDTNGVLSDQNDDWIAGRVAILAKRGVDQVAIGGAAPAELGIDAAIEGPASPDTFAKAIESLGHEPGAILFVGASSADVNAAASAGMRTFRYSRLARDVLQRRLDA